MKTLHKTFEENTIGNDYIVGDVHGCFHTLQTLLNRTGFNTTRDRLFCVGDLVDRGPFSESSLQWLKYDWFHCVTGNHEIMAVDYVNGSADWFWYVSNGGNWLVSNQTIQAEVRDTFEQLPVAFTINHRDEQIGVVHADCPVSDWKEFVELLEEMGKKDEVDDRDANLLNSAIWSRKRAQGWAPYVTNITRIFVGHTPVRVPQLKQNVVFIDNGAVYGNDLVLFDLSGNEIIRERVIFKND